MAGKLGAGAKGLWEALSGWKCWLVAVYLMAKELCHIDACVTSFGYGDAALKALGWDVATAAFDAKQAALAVAFLVAVGHRFFKAVQEYRAGAPAVEVLSPKV